MFSVWFPSFSVPTIIIVETQTHLALGIHTECVCYHQYYSDLIYSLYDNIFLDRYFYYHQINIFPFEVSSSPSEIFMKMMREISMRVADDNDSNWAIDTNAESTFIGAQLFFYLYLLLDIPSVLCCLLLFYYFFRLPELRQQHYSHQMIIYLLISAFLTNIIDVPLVMSYLHKHYFIASMSNPDSFCVFWIIYEYAICSVNLWLMAILSLERYLAIFFKPVLMANKKRRFFMYYVSAAVIFLFIFFWYIYLVALYPCEQIQFDYTQIACDLSCYQIVGSVILLNLDWIIAILLPIFLTLFFTLVLILHVFYQRQKISKRLNQQNTWKRTREMFLQLLPITFLFLLTNLPLVIVGLLSVSDPWYNTTPYFYVNCISFCLPLIIPFAVLSKQKVIRYQVSALIIRRRLNRTRPITIRTTGRHLMNT